MPEIDPPKLANLVQEMRQRLKLSQVKFAARLGIPFQSINRWENAHMKPSPLALKYVENVFAQLNDASDPALQVGRTVLSEKYLSYSGVPI